MARFPAACNSVWGRRALAMKPKALLLEVPLVRPRTRLELAGNPAYLECRQRVLEFLYGRQRFIEVA